MVDYHLELAGVALASIVVAMVVAKNFWYRSVAIILAVGTGGYWLLWLFTDDPMRTVKTLLG